MAVEEDPLLYIHSKVRVVDANGATQKQQSDDVVELDDATLYQQPVETGQTDTISQTEQYQEAPDKGF